MRKIDGFAQISRALRGQAVQVHIVGCQRRWVQLQTVKPGRVFGHGLAAACLHILQDARYGIRNVFTRAAFLLQELGEFTIEGVV